MNMLLTRVIEAYLTAGTLHHILSTRQHEQEGKSSHRNNLFWSKNRKTEQCHPLQRPKTPINSTLHLFPPLAGDFLGSRAVSRELGERVSVGEEKRTDQPFPVAGTRSSNTLTEDAAGLLRPPPRVTSVGCYHFQDNIHVAASASCSIKTLKW